VIVLYLLFQLGKDRYALEASRVVEVIPLLTLRQIPKAPRGIAGVFSYHGHPVPALDLCDLTLGQPASERLSTRVIIVNYPNESGTTHLLGLIAERATDVMRREARDFIDSGVRVAEAPYLGPVLMDGQRSIQLVLEQRLLSEPVRKLLFSNLEVIRHEPN
jgi:chemotaxis-related protein WspB